MSPNAPGPNHDRRAVRRSLRASLTTAIGSVLVVAATVVAASAAPAQTPVSPPPVPTTPTTPTTETPSTTTTTTTSTTAPATSTTTTTTQVPDEPDEPSSTTSTTAPDPDADHEGELIGGELPPEQVDLINRYREIQRMSSDLLTELSMLEGGLASAQSDLDQTQSALTEAEARRAKTEIKLADTERELERERSRLRERAVAAYMGGSTGSRAEAAILGAGSLGEAGVSRAYGNAVVDDDRQLIGRTAELRDRVDGLLDQADADRDDATRARDGLEARRAELEKRRDDAVETESRYAANAQARIQLLSEAAQLQAQIEAGYTRVQAVRDSISNVLATAQAGQVPPERTLGIFLSPLPNPRVNQPFGNQVDPIFGVARGHPGIDFNGQSGDPIRAAADGRVVASGWIDGYGNAVIIDHGNTLATLYAHQSLIAVKEGDVVRRGSVIGFVGSTGYSTGPHLHWEVRVLGQVVDPAPFIGEQR